MSAANQERFLAGWLNEPYRMEEVEQACRKLMQPFILREVVVATGLPKWTINRKLELLVKRGVLKRSKGNIPFVTPRGGKYVRSCYLYSFAAAE